MGPQLSHFLVRGPVAGEVQLGQADGAERERDGELDQAVHRADQLEAPAPDVGHQRALARQPEMVGDGTVGQRGLGVLLLAREISVTGLRSVAASEGVVIAAGDEGKTKTALQMIGIICLVVGYPYRFTYPGIDLGVVDLVVVGQLLVYLSLVFSLASAAQYVRLFAAAVDAKTKRS